MRVTGTERWWTGRMARRWLRVVGSVSQRMVELVDADARLEVRRGVVGVAMLMMPLTGSWASRARAAPNLLLLVMMLTTSKLRQSPSMLAPAVLSRWAPPQPCQLLCHPVLPHCPSSSSWWPHSDPDAPHPFSCGRTPSVPCLARESLHDPTRPAPSCTLCISTWAL